MGGRVGERSDDLQLFDHRTGPAVRHDQGQRIFVLRTDMDEMNVQPVDFGDEVWDRVDTGLNLAPVIFRLPVLQYLLHGLEWNALGKIGDGLLLRQAGFRQAPAKVGERRFRNADVEGTDGITNFRCFGGHWSSP